MWVTSFWQNYFKCAPSQCLIYRVSFVKGRRLFSSMCIWQFNLCSDIRGKIKVRKKEEKVGRKKEREKGEKDRELDGSPASFT